MRLRIEVPAQVYEFDLSDETGKYLKHYWENGDGLEWADVVDPWLSDVDVEMEAKLIE